MAKDGATASALSTFAKGRGLTAPPEFPEEGDLLTRGGKMKDSAAGALADGVEGSLAYYAYTYTSTDSDGHTSSEHRKYTIAVTRVSESIGFLPYLLFTGRKIFLSPGPDQDPEKATLAEGDAFDGTSLYVYRGVSREWLTELFSPALIDWLGRSPDDFGIELCNGVLVGARDGFLDSPQEVEALCTDLAHFATALRKESVEEIESGGAETSAAKADDDGGEGMKVVRARQLVDRTAIGSAPANVVTAKSELHRRAIHNPGSWRDPALASLAILAVLNVFGIAGPILLVVNGMVPVLVVVEIALFALIFQFTLRRSLREISGIAAREAFVGSYAKARGLESEEPLRFAATHAEADLAFKPDYVLTGTLPGGTNGSLAWVGTGETRSDRIAVVAGPSGPVATADLKVSPPGLSTDDLDAYAKRLSGKLAASPA